MFTQPLRFSAGLTCLQPVRIVICTMLFLQCACLHGSRYFLDRGNQLFAKGEYVEACLNFRKATQKDRNSAEAYFRLGTCQYAIHQKEDALASFMEAHTLDRKRKDILGTLADATFERFLEQKKPSKLHSSVQELIGELLAVDPESPTAIRLRGDLLLSDGKLGEAVPLFEKANQLQPGDPAIALPLADGLWKEGQSSEAEQVARQTLAKNQSFGPLYIWLSHFYRSGGQEAKAEEILSEYARRNPGDLNAVASFAVYSYERQQFAQAKPYLTNALKSAREPDRYVVIGDLYLACGDSVDAEQTFRSGLQADAERKTIYRLRLAKLYAADNKASEALRLLDENLQGGRTDIDSAVLRAFILGSTGKLTEGLAAARELLKQYPSDARVSAVLGSLLYSSGDLTAAKPQFVSALKLNPRGAEALAGMAKLNRDLHDYRQMLSYARQLCAVRPDDPSARLLLASALARTGDREHAEAELKLLSNDPSLGPQSKVELGLLYVAHREGKAAIELLRPMCSDTGTDNAVLSTLASAYVAAGEAESGLNFFKTLVPAREDEGENVRYLTGQLAEHAGQPAVAEQLYSGLIKTHPDAPLYLASLGVLLLNQGKADAAIPYARRAAELAPSNPAIATLAAEAYQAAGDGRQAMAAYEKAANLAPNDPAVLNNYAYLLASSNDTARQAIPLAKSALTLKPDDPDLSDTLAFAYLKAGDNAAALGMLDLLVRRFPERAAFRYHLALALSADGKARAARQQLLAGLADHPSAGEERDIRQLLTRMGS